MSRPSIVLATCAACLALASITASAQADYILNGGEFEGTFRIHDNGEEFREYFPPASARNLVETYGEDYAVTPDLSTLYQFTNSLGSSFYDFVYDVNSYSYLPNKLLRTGYDFNSSIYNASMALIRPSDPTGKGDLFVISGDAGFPAGVLPEIKRFNRTINNALANYIESIDPPTAQHIIDFGFGPDNRLYMAAQNGIYVYQESAAGFNLVSPTPLLGSLTGNLTFGPDGNLYLRDSVSGNVNRYSTARHVHRHVHPNRDYSQRRLLHPVRGRWKSSHADQSW